MIFWIDKRMHEFLVSPMQNFWWCTHLEMYQKILLGCAVEKWRVKSPAEAAEKYFLTSRKPIWNAARRRKTKTTHTAWLFRGRRSDDCFALVPRRAPPNRALCFTLSKMAWQDGYPSIGWVKFIEISSTYTWGWPFRLFGDWPTFPYTPRLLDEEWLPIILFVKAIPIFHEASSITIQLVDRGSNNGRSNTT